MDTEQEKVDKFFDRFIHIGGKRKLIEIGISVCIILLVAGCSIPMQDIIKNIEEYEIGAVLPMSMSIAGIFAAHLRIAAYETYTEKLNSLGSVLILLQYHPINRMRVMKIKIICQLRFLAKLTLVCLGVQLITTYVSYGTISWINFVYIIIFVLLLPAFYEILLMQFREKYLYGD